MIKTQAAGIRIDEFQQSLSTTAEIWKKKISVLCGRCRHVAQGPHLQIPEGPYQHPNTQWLDNHIRTRRKRSASLARLREEIEKRKKKLMTLKERVHLTTTEI